MDYLTLTLTRFLQNLSFSVKNGTKKCINLTKRLQNLHRSSRGNTKKKVVGNLIIRKINASDY